MARFDCDICRGSGLIRLPIYRRMSVVHVEPTATFSVDEMSRQYPCPECSDAVPEERIAFVETHSIMDAMDVRVPEDYALRHAARGIAAEILKGGFITLRKGPLNDRELTYSTVATVGVVSPKHVATIEQRVSSRQAEVAREVADVAERAILHWGSYYSGPEGGIAKSQAVRELREALASVLKKREAGHKKPAALPRPAEG